MKIYFSPEGPGSTPSASPAPAAPAAPEAAPASQPAPAAAPASESSSNSSLIPKDVLAIFEHNPFDQPTDPAAQTPAAAPSPAEQQGQPPAPAATATPPAPGADLGTLQQQIALLTEHALRTPATPPQGQPQAPDVALPQHGYSFTLPEPLVAAMASENPVERGQAIGALIQGTAQHVHREVVRHMRAEFARVMPQFVQQQIQAATHQQALATDFYSAYPQFNNPAIKQLVGTIAPQVAHRMGAQGWTVELRDAIAREVQNILQSVNGQAPQPAAPAPQAPGMPQILNGGARPAPAPVNDIEATLFG